MRPAIGLRNFDFRAWVLGVKRANSFEELQESISALERAGHPEGGSPEPMNMINYAADLERLKADKEVKAVRRNDAQQAYDQAYQAFADAEMALRKHIDGAESMIRARSYIAKHPLAPTLIGGAFKSEKVTWNNVTNHLFESAYWRIEIQENAGATYRIQAKIRANYHAPGGNEWYPERIAVNHTTKSEAKKATLLQETIQECQELITAHELEKPYDVFMGCGAELHEILSVLKLRYVFGTAYDYNRGNATLVYPEVWIVGAETRMWPARYEYNLMSVLSQMPPGLQAEIIGPELGAQRAEYLNSLVQDRAFEEDLLLAWLDNFDTGGN